MELESQYFSGFSNYKDKIAAAKIHVLAKGELIPTSREGARLSTAGTAVSTKLGAIHHEVLAPERDREHSTGHQFTILNVGFVERLRKFSPSQHYFQDSSYMSFAIWMIDPFGHDRSGWMSPIAAGSV
ncbi:hypothetical protein ACIQYF_13230 [Pseudomonas sp. NPDC096917]|uniref:hypothetical protein n=1 Tax=Pseudomonas sp. NPDC096917 TaxID=3364483 RepID=UPI003839DE44